MMNAYRALHKDTAPICYGDRGQGMDKVYTILEEATKSSYFGDLPFNENHVNVYRQGHNIEQLEGRTKYEFLGEQYLLAIEYWFTKFQDFTKLWNNHRPVNFGNGRYSSRGEWLNIVFRRATEVVCNHKVRRTTEKKFYLYIACAFTPSSPGWTQVTDQYVSESVGKVKVRGQYDYEHIRKQFDRMSKADWGQFEDQDNQKDDIWDREMDENEEEMSRRRKWTERYERRLENFSREMKNKKENYVEEYKTRINAFNREINNEKQEEFKRRQRWDERNDGWNGESVENEEEMRRRKNWRFSYETKQENFSREIKKEYEDWAEDYRTRIHNFRRKMNNDTKKEQERRRRHDQENNVRGSNAGNKVAFSDLMSAWKEVPRPGQDAEDYIMQGNRYADYNTEDEEQEMQLGNSEVMSDLMDFTKSIEEEKQLENLPSVTDFEDIFK